jgi:hypothetical protein
MSDELRAEFNRVENALKNIRDYIDANKPLTGDAAHIRCIVVGALGGEKHAATDATNERCYQWEHASLCGCQNKEDVILSPEDYSAGLELLQTARSMTAEIAQQKFTKQLIAHDTALRAAHDHKHALALNWKNDADDAEARVKTLEEALREIQLCCGGLDGISGHDAPEDVWGVAAAALAEKP